MTDSQRLPRLYTSNSCSHAYLVEQILKEHGIPVEVRNISEDSAAREELLQLNDGYASVPTLIMPDESKLVEPSLRELRERLGLPSPTRPAP